MEYNNTYFLMRNIQSEFIDSMKLQKGKKCHEELHNAISLWNKRCKVVITKKGEFTPSERMVEIALDLFWVNLHNVRDEMEYYNIRKNVMRIIRQQKNHIH